MMHVLRLRLAALCSLLCLAWSVAGAQALQPIPKFESLVTDLTGTLTAAEQNQIDQTLTAYQQRKGSQIAVLLVGRIHLSEARGQIELFAGRYLMHGAADGCLDVDRRVQAAFRQTPRQHDVPVQDGARRVCDRVVLIVAFGEHGIERGDGSRPVVAVARARAEGSCRHWPDGD